MREFWSKLSRLMGRAPDEADLDTELREEMRSHLALAIDENLANGMGAEDARRAAHRRLGNDTLAQELAREAWRFPRIESVMQDLRYGLRGIRRTPGFSVVVILTLALGIGVNAAMFSVLYAVLLRPLPYPSGERLVTLGESTSKASGFSVTWTNFQHWNAENRSFEQMAAWTGASPTMTGRGEVMVTNSVAVTSNFLPLTGARPLLGRLFTPSDDIAGAVDTAVLSGEFWSKKFGGDPKAVGSTITLNGKPYEVIGVLPPGRQFFTYPVDLYLPLGPIGAKAKTRSQHDSIRGLGLLKPGVTLTEARVDLNGIMERLAIDDPGPESDHRSAPEYLTESRIGDVRSPLMTLMAASVFVLLIACANVASLLLVRSTTRAREIAIRSAIGAGRARLTRQLITENLVVAALGGAVGLILVKVALSILVKTGPQNIPRLADSSVDFTVFSFCAAVTILVGVLAAVAPVISARRLDLSVALKEGSAASGAGRQGSRFRNCLVVAEISITVVLAFGSGLLLRSLISAQRESPGYDPSHVLAVEFDLPHSAYPNATSKQQFYSQITDALRREPGVASVGATNCAVGDCWDYWYSIPGKRVPAKSDVPISLYDVVDSEYFPTLRIRLLAGRNFTSADREKGAPVAIINQEIARQYWKTPQDAIGGQVKNGGPYMDGPTYEIVGVVDSVKQLGLDQAPVEVVYVPSTQRESSGMVVMIRTVGDPAVLIPAVRRHVTSIDRNVPILTMRPFEDWLGTTLERRRFSTWLLSVFALLAMTLAGVGIYGVLNYWVRVRHREIAIRLAMGARRPEILQWAGMHALRLALIGGVLGGLGSWAADKWLKSELFGVGDSGMGMIMAAAIAVLAMTLLAASVPLFRATRVDAVRHLHEG